MLYTVAKLAQHGVRNVERILADEVHADALGAHQPDNLLDLFQQRAGRFVEEQVRFIEEEDEFGLVAVADLRQLFKEVGQEPQQERGIQARRVQQSISRQDVHNTVTGRIGLHEVIQVEHRLTKKHLGALLFQHQKVALDRPHRGCRNIAVLGGERLGVVPHVLDHGPQILGIDQQQAVIVGNLEDQVQHAFLSLVQTQHARQQHRAQVRHRGAKRVPLLAEHIPQGAGQPRKLRRRQVVLRNALAELRGHLPRLRDPGEIALHIGHEHRHTDAAKAFREHLQSHGLAGAGGPGDQAMTVRQRRQQAQIGLGATRQEQGFGHGSRC